MRVLVDARVISDHFPGIGRYTYHLIRALQVWEEVEIYTLVDATAQDSRFPPPTSFLPPNRVLPLDLSPFALPSQWRIPLLARQLPVDLYHSPYYLFPYAIPLPTVVTLHDAIPSRFPQYFPPLKRILIRFSKYMATRKARRILVDSYTTAKDIAQVYKVPPSRMAVVPLAPPPSYRPPSSREIDRVREKYHLPPCYFLYVGSAKPHKNVRLLLTLWGREALPCPLILAGLAHPTTHDLPPQVRQLGRVPEADLPALYGGAQGVLFPSLYEGFGLPVLEAMACGAPVVYSDIPVLREVAGPGGWPVPPHDVTAWADAVRRLVSDMAWREMLRERGREQAGRYTWEKTAKATLQVYREALGSS